MVHDIMEPRLDQAVPGATPVEPAMERHICIHAHFYQPPRESPWLESIEIQDSAYPYHDWNERITAECYAPIAASPVIDGEGRTLAVVNDYTRVSFNVGPTLLAWMERRAPDVIRAILDADAQSRARFGGHGAAIAQAYNHMIMPLASARDQATQVAWGIRDFERRFGRAPEGMWLPETAVDTASLEALAARGIRFTILAPHQAARTRRIGDEAWRDVSGGRVDPSKVYRALLPSGREIALFFYDGPVSRAVAFERLLESGERFAARLTGDFDAVRLGPQLMHIASDGETYGHHHRHGELALAYALHHIEARGLARITVYGEYLDIHPPAHEVQIEERTAWSCAHGVERWRSDCGCSSGRPGWNQKWRGPLRAALDWLRDTLAPLYEARAGDLLRDPWRARDDYIDVVLDRSRESVDRFLAAHARRPLEAAEETAALKLLEMQRHAMLMYTSCGWFFDDLSGIETTQILQYASRAIQLGEEIAGEAIEAGFLERLDAARSNLPEHGGGRHVYERLVVPARADLRKVCVNHALAVVLGDFVRDDGLSCAPGYTMERHEEHLFKEGRAKLGIGQVTVRSELTRESERFTFAALHCGDLEVSAAVGVAVADEVYAALVRELGEAFERADFVEVLRLMHDHLGGPMDSLRSLFRDEQRRVLDALLVPRIAEVEAACRDLVARHAPLVRLLGELDAPVPQALRAAAEIALNADLREALRARTLDRGRIAEILAEARVRGFTLDAALTGAAWKLT
jgi:hypothetical protein